jgi:DNA-binding CsgD family transcriptional regulator
MSLQTAGLLVGRDSELALLTNTFRDLSRGSGNAVLIEGEPGIGKSTLVRAVVDEAIAPQALEVVPQVFWGTGDELGQELPLLPFLDALKVRTPGASTRRNAIAAMLRGEGTGDRGTDVTAAIAEQLLALITDECAQQPVILVIDDLQWTDPATVTLWGRLARLAPQIALLLVGITRPVPQREDLVKLRRAQNDAIRVNLTALSDDAVAELVTNRAGGTPDAPLLRLTHTAAGNPFYVTEIIDVLWRSGGLTIEAGRAQLASGITPMSLPKTLSATIADRLGFVPEATRRMLRMAALLGVQFAVPDLAVVLGQSVQSLMAGVEEAQTVGVLAESGGDLAFRHPLIHAALYDEMSLAVRTALHREAARNLAAAGAPVDRVARQLLRAADGPDANTLAVDALSSPPLDDWMLKWLTDSADLLVSQAPTMGVGLLSRAVAGTLVTSPRYGWLASRLADALSRTGDQSRAEQIARQALDQIGESDPDVLVDLHWTLAQCRISAGSGAESLATLEEALSTPGISARHRARLLVQAARTRSMLGEVDASGQVAADALSAAEDTHDTWSQGWALHVLSFIALVRGQHSQALSLLDRALSVTQADPALTDLRLLLQINKSVSLANRDQLPEALATGRQAQHLANQVGTTIRLTQAHTTLGQILFEMGRWDDALIDVVAVPENLKDPSAACCDLGVAAVISFHRGQIDAARRDLATAIPHAKAIGQRLVTPLALARSLDNEQTGAFPEALAELTQWFDGTSEELGQAEDLIADAVRLSVKTGNLETARDLAKQAAEFAENSDILRRQANALYCSGLVEHDASKLIAAADRYQQASRPHPMARALEAAAEEFIAVDDRNAARDAFGRAVDAYTSLGAAADVNRVQAAFREQGMRLGSHAKHRKAQSGWDALTDTELKIAAFVAEGLSNPDIAQRLVTSPRTVGTHVSHILKKLQFASRAEIAREYALRGGAR